MKNYETLMNTMTPERMAELNVKLVTVNNRDLYYLTSTGQLYLTSQYEDAVRHEYNWLIHDPEATAAVNTNVDSKVNTEEASKSKKVKEPK